MKIKELKNIYGTLIEMCEQAGTDLTQICRDAGIDRSIPERWKKENPKTLQIVVKLFQAIEKKNKKKPSDTPNKIIPVGGKQKLTR